MDHAVDDFLGLKGDRFDRRTHEMAPVDAPRQSQDGAASMGIPMGSAQSDKSWDHVNPIRILDHRRQLFALLGRTDQLQLVSQPLDDCAGDKCASFQGIGDFPSHTPGDGGQEAGCRGSGLPAGIHQHETTGSVGGLNHTRVETALAEKGCLLISGDPGDGNGRIQDLRIGEGHGMAGRYNLGK